MRSNIYTSLFMQFVGIVLVIWLLLPSGAVLNGDGYLGSGTRDLFDHIALLDQWRWSTTHWNYPDGGALIPPDIFSMMFALPWWWLGRGVAYDMALATHLLLNAISGWYLAKSIGGSPWIGAITILSSPFLVGQINSGETETIGLWGLAFTLTFLWQQRWKLRARNYHGHRFMVLRSLRSHYSVFVGDCLLLETQRP